MRKTINSAIPVIIILSLVTFLSCSSSNDGDNGTVTSNDPGTQNDPVTYEVDVNNSAFSPASLSIQIGDRVVWTNMDNFDHRVKSDDGTSFDSGNLGRFQTYEIVLTTSGTFPYHCGIHSFMTGSITVNPAS